MNLLLLPPMLAVFGWDDLIYYAILLGTTAATTYASYSATTQAADRQAKNAEAQAALEAQQAAAERDAALRAKQAEQRRFRQQQAAAISGQGIQFAGTPLDILADTEVQSALELQNIDYANRIQQMNIANRRESGLSDAAANKPSTGATLLAAGSSLLSQAGSAYASQPRTQTTTKPTETAFTGGTIHTTSQRPY